MKGNWGLMVVAAASVTLLVAACLGAELARWEYITQSAVLLATSLLGYAYSRGAR